MRIILALILMSAICINPFAGDQTSDKNISSEKSTKAIEFSIGGGLIHSYVQGFGFDTEAWVGPPSQSINLNIPASFIYYPSQNFGIGIIYQVGCEMLFLYGFSLKMITINNKLNVVNKFGNKDKKSWFLLEYGINLNYSFDFMGRYFLYNAVGYPFDVVDYLSFGPDIFFGYEKIFKTNYEMTIGFSFNGPDYQFFNSNYNNDYSGMLF